MARLSEVTLSRVARGGVLAGFGTLVLIGGDVVLSRFLSSNVALRALIGAGVLLLLGVVELYRAFTQAMRDEAFGSTADATADHAACDHAPHEHARHDHTDHDRSASTVSHTHGHSDVGPIWALLLPLVLLPAAVNSSSANIAANRLYTTPDVGVVRSGPVETLAEEPITETADAIRSMPPEDDRALPEIVYRLLPERGSDGVFEFESANFSLLPYVVTFNPDRFLRERVRMVGFVHREKSWPENTFVLGRLSIWCCTADASLVGMWITLNRKAPPTGTWLEVEGTVDIVERLEFGERSMERVPALTDVVFEIVPQPSNEYTPAPVF